MIYIERKRNIDKEEWIKIIQHLHLYDQLLNSSKIIIKLNLASGSTADSQRHVVSDFELLSDLIKNINSMNQNAEIYIAEGDSTGYGFAFLKFKHLELLDRLKLYKHINDKVKLLDLSRDVLKKIYYKRFKYFNDNDKQLWLSQTLLESDFIISMSNLKTHSITKYSGACKNLFGCLPESDKSVFHPFIDKVIHDVTIAIKPHLNIVDGFFAMEGNGPVQGNDLVLGYRCFSNNPVEADIYSSYSVGINPLSIKYLKYLCESTGMDKNDILNYRQKIKYRFKKPQLFLRIMNAIGLTLQKAGQAIAKFGHNIHSCNNLIVLIVTILRPILIKLFNIDTLKTIKKKFQKWY